MSFIILFLSVQSESSTILISLLRLAIKKAPVPQAGSNITSSILKSIKSLNNSVI